MVPWRTAATMDFRSTEGMASDGHERNCKKAWAFCGSSFFVSGKIGKRKKDEKNEE